jgi:hypothetical protein
MHTATHSSRNVATMKMSSGVIKKSSELRNIMKALTACAIMIVLLWALSPGPGVLDPTPEEVAAEMAKHPKPTNIQSIFNWSPSNPNGIVNEKNPHFPMPSTYDSGGYPLYDDEEYPDYLDDLIYWGKGFGHGKPIPLIILELASQQVENKARSVQTKWRMREERDLAEMKRVRLGSALLGLFFVGIGAWYVTLLLPYSFPSS